MRLLPKAFVSAAVLTFALAACANNSPTTSAAAGVPSSSTFSATGSPVSSTGSAVDSTNNSKYGTILVDSSGMTLYVNTQDTAGTPKAGAGVQASKLAIAMIGSADQVIYYGHPLYTYSGDMAAGDTNGQGMGGVWYVVSTKGTPVTSSSSGGGGGYSRSGY